MAAGVPTSDVMAFLRANRGLPQPQTEQQPVPPYADLSGIAVVHQGMQSDQMLTDLGVMRALTNPTPGTAVAYALQTAFSATAALMVFQNVSKKRARFSMKKLSLALTVAPTATVSLELAAVVDDTPRVPTAGFVTARMLNPNLDSPEQSDILCHSFSAAAATIPTAGPNARTVSRGRIATGLGIVGDSYTFQFGGGDQPVRPPLTAVRATDPGQLATIVNPASIGPGQFLILYLWWLTAATTAPSFEWEASGIEKV